MALETGALENAAKRARGCGRPEAARDLLDIDAVINEQGGMGVAEVMETDLRETGGGRIGVPAVTGRVNGKMGRAAADEEIRRKTGHAALETEVHLQLVEKVHDHIQAVTPDIHGPNETPRDPKISGKSVGYRQVSGRVGFAAKRDRGSAAAAILFDA